PRREADDLQERRELHGDVERRMAGEQTRPLHQQEHERGDRREVPERGSPLPALRNGDGDRKAREQQGVGPGCERRRAHDGKDAERRERVGHKTMNEAEPHSAASRAGGALTGRGTASSRARYRSSGSAPTERSARATPPALVAIATRSP